METKMLLLHFGAIWYFSSGFGLCLTFRCRLSCSCLLLPLFLFFAVLFSLCVFYQKVHEDWPFTKCKTTSPGPMFFGTVYLLWSFGFVCSDLNPLSGCRDVTLSFPSGTPSGWLHLQISHTCHPVWGALEDKVLGGYYWLCLRVWLRCRDSYSDALPFLPPARSAAFQPNDHSSCLLWRRSEGFLAWGQRLYYRENHATGPGSSCLLVSCILLIYFTCTMVG